MIFSAVFSPARIRSAFNCVESISVISSLFFLLPVFHAAKALFPDDGVLNSIVLLSCIKTGCQRFQFLRSAICENTCGVVPWITTDLTVMTFDGINNDNNVIITNNPVTAIIKPLINLIPYSHLKTFIAMM